LFEVEVGSIVVVVVDAVVHVAGFESRCLYLGIAVAAAVVVVAVLRKKKEKEKKKRACSAGRVPRLRKVA
jgi:hypothetical protein